ncbi:MAG: (Fe-S)-binding protein [Ruminococcaceae bacterium]|nr:(Fe-S)-binding protein [Oscillospiraceae bacterium]
MSKRGNMVVRIHQAVSFHAFMTRIPRTEAVFWPGCALMTLDPAILNRTLEVLKRAEPGIQMAAACCGNPTASLFPEALNQRKQKLLTLLESKGVKRIYTACPNCTLQLRKFGLEVIPIWQVLAECLTADDLSALSGSYVWHDPCPTRNDHLQQEAVRKILALRGCDCTEPIHTGCKTLCCGNRKMLHCTNPEASRKIREKRLAEFPEDRTIASSCEGCLSAFRGAGRDTAHLLEILFGKSKSRGWGNRIKNTWK